MSMTMAEMQNLSTLSPLEQRVIYSILRPSAVLDRLPFDDIGDLQTLVMEATGLPVPTHRPINPTAITVATAQFGQRTESLKIMSDQIRVDRQQLNNKSSNVDPRVASIEQYTKSVSYETVNTYLRGDPVATPDEPSGLVHRFLTDLRISNGSATPATQLQVIDANAQNRGTADADDRDLISDIHELMSLLDGGDVDVLISNRQFWLRLGAAARNQRMFRTTEDSFGRMVMTFGDGGPPVLDAGYPPAGAFDRSVQVLPTGTTENDLFTDAVYAVKYGKMMSGGLQKRAPETLDLKEDQQSFPFVAYFFEWVYGFQLTNPFSVAVLRRAI